MASFSLFVSVRAHPPQHTLMKGEYMASRHVGASKSVGDPFTDLGFDQFATMTNRDDVWTLEKVITDAHMVTLGRPLYVCSKSVYCAWSHKSDYSFATRYYPEDTGTIPQGISDDNLDLIRRYIVPFAAQKLIGMSYFRPWPLTPEQQLACLAHRLPIEFISASHAGVEQQKQQVEGHLRVAMKIESGFRTMETVCPSEPILAEGACSVMRWPHSDAPKALENVLNVFAVHQGDRGELVALLLLLIARDNAVRKRFNALDA